MKEDGDDCWGEISALGNGANYVNQASVGVLCLLVKFKWHKAQHILTKPRGWFFLCLVWQKLQHLCTILLGVVVYI